MIWYKCIGLRTTPAPHRISGTIGHPQKPRRISAITKSKAPQIGPKAASRKVSASSEKVSGRPKCSFGERPTCHSLLLQGSGATFAELCIATSVATSAAEVDADAAVDGLVAIDEVVAYSYSLILILLLLILSF